MKEDALLDEALNAEYQDEDVNKQAWVEEHQKRFAKPLHHSSIERVHFIIQKEAEQSRFS